MRYSNIIVIKNYDILHIISIIMRVCMIKHPGTNALTVRTPTTTNERLPAKQKERLPRNHNSTVYRGCPRENMKTNRYLGKSGKQSALDMHALQDDDGRGPCIPCVMGGRHKPVADM